LQTPAAWLGYPEALRKRSQVGWLTSQFLDSEALVILQVMRKRGGYQIGTLRWRNRQLLLRKYFFEGS